MPFARHARITVTNEGKEAVGAFYYNIDYRTYSHPLPPNMIYFHAEYRQAQPNHGLAHDWTTNGDVNNMKNLTGQDNYVWMEAKGHGQYVGVTMSVLQNQDMWWGEGDDMFFIDGAKTPSIVGTGSEDYFLGAWDFGGQPFTYQLYGAPVVGAELAGGRSSVYRFIWLRRFPSRNRSKQQLSTGMLTRDRIISILSLTGIRPSLTSRSLRFRR